MSTTHNTTFTNSHRLGAEATAADEALVRRFRHGDPSAFDPLFRRHRDRVHQLITRIVADPDDAMDMTQDVFLKAYQGLAQFNGKAKFRTWLYRIAVNCSIDYMRRKAVRRVILCRDDAYLDETAPMTASGAPGDRLAREELWEQIRQAMTTLTPKQRQVFTLRHRDELPLKQIAQRLNRNVGTIKAHLFGARQRLREQMLPYLSTGRTAPNS